MSSSWIREKNKNWDGTYIKPWKRGLYVKKIIQFYIIKKNPVKNS